MVGTSFDSEKIRLDMRQPMMMMALRFYACMQTLVSSSVSRAGGTRIVSKQHYACMYVMHECMHLISIYLRIVLYTEIIWAGKSVSDNI